MIYAVIDFAFFRQHHNVILRAVRYIQSPHYFILLLDQKQSITLAITTI